MINVLYTYTVLRHNMHLWFVIFLYYTIDYVKFKHFKLFFITANICIIFTYIVYNSYYKNATRQLEFIVCNVFYNFSWFLDFCEFVTVAIILGGWNCLSILGASVDCLISGMWQMVAGFIVATIEAPCCCLFIDYVQNFSDWVEKRPYWNRAAGYCM